jgi:hypothetical protein
MPKISAADGTKRYVEETGSGTPLVFVHDYAGDCRSIAGLRTSRPDPIE